jgi:hypothetical protein
MPVFASTTTSGYSDPLKAMSIKALEQRYKEMSAQQAAAQQGMFTPENTQTPVQGLAQVANVAVDAMRSRRADEATAAGRNELAGVIAQGPQGPNGQWSPQQQAVMSRRSPDDLTKIWQQYHEDKQNVRTEGGLNARNTETQNATTARTNAEIEGRAKVSAGTNASNEAQTLMTTGTQREIAAGVQSGSNTRQDSAQAHEARQTRLKAELDAEAQELKYAQENRMADRTEKAKENITRLTAELQANENRQGEAFKASQLEKEFSQNATIKGLDREAARANLQLELANRSGIAADRIAAEKDLARINAAIDREKQTASEAFKSRMQTQAEGATAEIEKAKLLSAEKQTAAEAKAKADALASDPKRNEAIRSAETDYRKGLSHIDNLEEATRILEHPKGIYTGAMQGAAPIAGGIPGVGGMLVDKEKAQNTARFNTIVGEDAIRDMATTLKGSSTNYEMGEFKKMKNDPNISDAQRANQLRKVVKAARADLEAQARETKAIGGNVERVDKSMKGGDADPLEGRTANGPDGPIIRRNGKWEKL